MARFSLMFRQVIMIGAALLRPKALAPSFGPVSEPAIASLLPRSPELGSHISMLTMALNRASEDSSRVVNRIVWLTVGLVVVGFLHALATAWPWLSWWWQHR
jgi:hypothetical protein